MLEILKETDRRLVMTLGDRKSRWTRFVLDKDAGRAWFERRQPWWPERTLTVALTDIVSIGSQSVGSDDSIVLTTPKARHRIAGEAGYTPSAAERMRAFVGIEATEAPHVTRLPLPLREWGTRAVTATAVTAVAAVGVWLVVALGGFVAGAAGTVGGFVASAAARTQNALLLPACDAPQSRDAIQELVRDRLGGGATLGDLTQRGQSGGERLCSAIARRDGRTANVSYRNYWDGWTPKVRLTGDVVTAKLDSARIEAIARAADAFLTAGRNSHVTGKPPRQTDPGIDAALATILGASDLAAEPLTPEEIDKALDWLKTADRIGAVYLLAGTGYEDFANVPPSDKLQQRMRGNVTAFADEFGRYADFQMITLAAVAKAQMRASTGSRTDTAQRTNEIRMLVSQAMKSNFIALVYDGHNDVWRMARLTTLGRTAPVAAKFLSKDDAQAVRDLALKTVDYFTDETVRARVREVAGLLQ